MTTITFKADKKFKTTLDQIAKMKGINTSAYIKLVLTKSIKHDIAEEMAMRQFAELSEKSFEFWNNPDDDIYQQFYENQTR